MVPLEAHAMKYWYSNSTMTPSLTPHERSELSALLLQEVGKLTLLHEQHALTQYGYGRMDTLTALYHKLNPTTVAEPVAAPEREAFRNRLIAAFATHADRDVPMSPTTADFVYDVLFLQGHRAPKIEATKYLRQYAELPLHKAKAILDEVTR